MASGERYYLLELTHRPAVYGDLGNILKIEGLVVGGAGIWRTNRHRPFRPDRAEAGIRSKWIPLWRQRLRPHR